MNRINYQKKGFIVMFQKDNYQIIVSHCCFNIITDYARYTSEHQELNEVSIHEKTSEISPDRYVEYFNEEHKKIFSSLLSEIALVDNCNKYRKYIKIIKMNFCFIITLMILIYISMRY